MNYRLSLLAGKEREVVRCLTNPIIAALVCFQYSIGRSDVLWDQSRIARPDVFTHNVAYYDRELTDVPSLSTYQLAGIVVPGSGWRVSKVTVYFEMPAT